MRHCSAASNTIWCTAAVRVLPARGSSPPEIAGDRRRSSTSTQSWQGQRMSSRGGVVTVPGSLHDRDAGRARRPAGAEPVPLWHADRDLRGVDAVVLPGGFSYGDYLRCGAIARFAPIMESLVPAAKNGLPVLGICNGF